MRYRRHVGELADDGWGDAFAAALEAGDAVALATVPKADLHNHAVLGGESDFLARRLGIRVAPLEHPLDSMAQMHEWVSQHLGAYLHDPDDRLTLYEAALVLAERDGVTRLEIGVDVWDGTLHSSAAVLSRKLHDIHAARGSRIEWLPQLGLSRHVRVDALRSWLEPFLELGTYRSIDLSGDEFARPIEEFIPLYRLAGDRGLRRKAHVGEWGSADDVLRAVDTLELDEVQHGIAAATSRSVMRSLAAAGVRLNICVTSNLRLGRAASVASHPIRALYDAGIPVTVNTDDALVFGTSVSKEFLALYRAGLFSSAELNRIRLTGLADSTAARPVTCAST